MKMITILGGYSIEETPCGPVDAPIPMPMLLVWAEDPALLQVYLSGSDIAAVSYKAMRKKEEEEVLLGVRADQWKGSYARIEYLLNFLQKIAQAPPSRPPPTPRLERTGCDALGSKVRAEDLARRTTKSHHGTITMKAVKAMSKQQLSDEYEYICRPIGCSAASNYADDPDSAGGGSFNPAGSATPMTGSAVPDTAGGTLGTTVTASTVPTSAAMDSAGSHHELGISPFADSADSSSPSPVSTDHIPIDVLFEPTSGGINEFFLDSDEDEQIGMSRVAAEPDSDDEVLAEILFRGQYISGAGVVIVDKLPDDEIVDPRVKVETISAYASSPSRSESESDDDMENYIPPIPYGAFKDWEIVRCRSVKPLGSQFLTIMSGCCCCWEVILKVQAGFEDSFECLAFAPLCLLARQMVLSSPWTHSKKELAQLLQYGFGVYSNPLIAMEVAAFRGCCLICLLIHEFMLFPLLLLWLSEPWYSRWWQQLAMDESES
ncbi:hypothetical protein Tco_0966883 [Tanacetum coccineum]